MLELDYNIFGNTLIYDILDEDKPAGYEPVPLRVPVPDTNRIPPGYEDSIDRRIDPTREPQIIDRDDSDNGIIILDL